MLAISLLGQPLMTLDGVPITGFVSQKASVMLSYLAVESHQPHGRTALAELFWPDQSEDVARKNLRDILFNLQKLLGNQAANPPYLDISRHTIQFNINSDHTLDTDIFSTLLSSCENHRHKQMDKCQVCAFKLRQAISLYRGEFLAGSSVSGSPTFENWMALTRERLQQMALEGLHYLTRFHARRQEFTQARRHAQRQVELAPWLETAYRQLMALSALSGQRGAALAHYETCRQRLAEELDVAPGPETTALYEQIKAGHRPLKISSLPIVAPPPHQIPAQTTSFLGREQEQLEIADYLQDPECRLLTLVGPGGSGKTRLAIQSALEEISNFAHGVFFVPLAALMSADSLPLALADALNLSLSGNKPPQEQVLNYIREKELLLVLDNFESLLGDGRKSAAVDFLVNILQHAPTVVMLITSRQPIGLHAERLFDLDGLPYPDANTQVDLEVSESIQLFLERAHRVQPRFQVSPEALASIAAICRLTEGLPLGIELAAAGARNMTSSEILAAMNRSLDALAADRLDVPLRHRSIRATFAYSWAMLSAKEQRAFCDLSVFRGGFVAAATTADQQTLSALVDKSLLRLEGNGRYQMHELLRQFGEEKLREDAAAEKAARDHHCAWIANFLQDRELQLTGEQQLAALAEIRDEIENVRAGWNWAVAHKKDREIEQSMPSISRFYDLRGWFQEGAELFGKAAAVMQDSGVLYGRLLSYHAAFTYRLGQYEPAQELFQQSLAVFHQLDTPHETIFTLNGLGAIATFRGQFADAKKYAADGLALSQQTGDRYEQAKSLDTLGIVARYEGRLADAKPYFQNSLEIYKQLGNQFGQARCYNYLGNAAITEGAYEEALTMFSRAIDISQALDYRYLMAYLLNNMGNVTALLNRHPEALNYFRQSLAQFQDLGDQFGIAMAQNNLGHMFLLTEDDEEAEEHFRAAIRGGQAMQASALVLDALVGIATLMSHRGPNNEALALASLVLHHDAARSETKQKAEKLTAVLTEHLSPQQAASAQAKGETLSLADITAQFLEQEKFITHNASSDS